MRAASLVSLLGWGARAAVRRPDLWIGAALVGGLLWLASRLSPFPAVGLDSAWTTAHAWRVPLALGATSLALTFLTRRESFLARVAPRVRWGAEVGTLLVAPLLAWLVLGLAALVTSTGGAVNSEGWLADLLWIDLHMSGIALCTLALPFGAGARVLALWALLWFLPVLLEGVPLGFLVDVGRHEVADSPLASLVLCAGLHLVGAGLAPGRHLPVDR